MRKLSKAKGVYVYLLSEYLSVSLKKIGDILKINSTNAIYKLKEKGLEYIEQNESISE